ncbi:MAG: hypothetical protein OEX19_05840 [Gammaproteobacteria bacterium]|nr:hypothetical protein [Gammaproteobacteria bacterium]
MLIKRYFYLGLTLLTFSVALNIQVAVAIESGPQSLPLSTSLNKYPISISVPGFPFPIPLTSTIELDEHLLGPLSGAYNVDFTVSDFSEPSITFDGGLTSFPATQTALFITTQANTGLVADPSPIADLVSAVDFTTDPVTFDQTQVDTFMASLNGVEAYGIATMLPGQTTSFVYDFDGTQSEYYFYFGAASLASLPPDVSYSFTVSPVPEAEVWFMMLLGLGAVGVMVRRSQQNVPRLAVV